MSAPDCSACSDGDHLRCGGPESGCGCAAERHRYLQWHSGDETDILFRFLQRECRVGVWSSRAPGRIQEALERAFIAGQLSKKEKEPPPPTDRELSVCAILIKETEGCQPGGGFALLRQCALEMVSRAKKT